jgi:hypothetical protein
MRFQPGFRYGASVAVLGALGLLSGETDGFAIDATTADGGTVAVIDTGTPANDLSNVILDASNLVQSGTSPKMVHHLSSPYVRWSAHNMFLNSGAPATQNVTLVVGFVYTVTVTGAGGGSITGSDGASGVATTGSPATFTATTTTGTFTYAATLTTIQLNRGEVATPYVATTGAIRIGIPQSYDTAAAQYGILVEPAATNLALYSDDFTNAAWTKSNMNTAKTATGPDNGTNSASTLTASAGNATALQAITSASSARITGMWVKRRTGSGNIDLTQDNGSTWQTMTVTADWTRVNLTAATLANPTVGIRVVTNADAVDVFGFQHEVGSTLTSTIPTIGSTVTRASDNLQVAVSTIPYDQTEGTIYFDFKEMTPPAETFLFLWRENDDNTWYLDNNTSARRVVGNDGGGFAVVGSLGAPTYNARVQISNAAKTNDWDWSIDGGAVAGDTSGALPNAMANLWLGRAVADNRGMNAFLYRFIYVPRQVETDTNDLDTWRYNF